MVDNDGIEADGLVCRGKRVNGGVFAGGSLTMDQYNEDQIIALHYDQSGTTKTEGLTFADRPGARPSGIGPRTR